MWWIDAKGREVAISSMTTKHIEMSIAKIKRDNWRTSYLPYLEAELDKRVKLDQFYTGATKDISRFSLGLSGERWEPQLPALEVPVNTPYMFVYVTRHDGLITPWAVFEGYGKFGSSERQWYYFTDLIMLAAFIHEHERSLT